MFPTPKNTAFSTYTFGSIMVSVSKGEYRYGFNGKETDNETGLQDYGFRIYNPSIGKFLSVDPLSRDYPWNSTYAFAENRPIDGVDLEGLEYVSAVNWASTNIGNYSIPFMYDKDAPPTFKSLKKSTWKDVINGSMYCATSTALSYAQANPKVAEYLLEKWPDITLFLTKDSYTPSRDVLKEGPYYFTGEEVNQCLNSGRYGGNGYSKTPKIIKANYVCYNAEYYSLNINYGITIMRVMIKFLLPAFQQTVIENFALSKSGCEELVSVFNSYSHTFGVIGVNYDRISQKNYGRYMSEVSYTNQEITPQIARPDSGLSNRILIPNEKNVTIPLFD